MATVVGILDRDFWSANTDNIVIADPVTKSLTWIPRDLWCPSLRHRINKAFARGGVARLVSALHELGFPCDYGLVLRRSATERAAASISVTVPVREPLYFRYPLHPTQPIEEGQTLVSFLPPSERLEGRRIHEWVGARKGVAQEGAARHTTDWHRMRRQQMFLQALLEQRFDFMTVIADSDLVEMPADDALRELASVDSSWRMQTFQDVDDERIDDMRVLVKQDPPCSLGASDSGAPQLAVVVLALGAPLETVDAIRSVLEQEPREFAP